MFWRSRSRMVSRDEKLFGLFTRFVIDFIPTFWQGLTCHTCDIHVSVKFSHHAEKNLNKLLSQNNITGTVNYYTISFEIKISSQKYNRIKSRFLQASSYFGNAPAVRRKEVLPTSILVKGTV